MLSCLFLVSQNAMLEFQFACLPQILTIGSGWWAWGAEETLPDGKCHNQNWQPTSNVLQFEGKSGWNKEKMCFKKFSFLITIWIYSSNKAKGFNAFVNWFLSNCQLSLSDEKMLDLNLETYFAALELLWSISGSTAAGWSLFVIENKLSGTLKLWDTFCLCMLVDLIEGISRLGLQHVELEAEPDPLSDLSLPGIFDSSVVDKQRCEAKGGAGKRKK